MWLKCTSLCLNLLLKVCVNVFLLVNVNVMCDLYALTCVCVGGGGSHPLFWKHVPFYFFGDKVDFFGDKLNTFFWRQSCLFFGDTIFWRHFHTFFFGDKVAFFWRQIK